MYSDRDRQYMALALELAEKGRGHVSPNPMVGAVVVRDDVIVGRGWHKVAGGPHAEVFAIREAGEKTRGATMYVTLEPCCHFGKTPPCTDRIVESGISRVVIAMQDVNPLVCGEGCITLEEHGIEVQLGLFGEKSRRLNEAFVQHITTGRPFVSLKLATTLDGYIADSDGGSKWITGPAMRARVHQWRAWSDAVLVGSGTVLNDDPSLTVRDVEGDDPLRVIVDSRLRVSPDARVFKDGNALLATLDHPESAFRDYIAKDIDIVRLPGHDGSVSLDALMKELGKRDIVSLFCEGGGVMAGALLKAHLVDKVLFTVAPKILGQGKRSVDDAGVPSISGAINVSSLETEHIGNDVVLSGYPVYRNDS